MKFMEGMSAFTKGVGQKAKGNYDIVTMNSKVSSLIKETRMLYTEIGEVYYHVHKDDSEETLRSMVEKITSMEAEITDIKQQIEETKTDIASVSLSAPLVAEVLTGDGSGGFCEKCGASLLADSLFCVECGAKLFPAETEQEDFTKIE